MTYPSSERGGVEVSMSVGVAVMVAELGQVAIHGWFVLRNEDLALAITYRPSAVFGA